MAFYEIIFIVRQDVPSAQVKALAEEYRSLIQSQGGEVAKVEYCGLRTLAYKIRKNRKGHYVLMHVGVAPKVLNELERRIRLHEDVLRFLTVSIEEMDPNPSVLAQVRTPRERQGGYNSGAADSRQPLPQTHATDDAVPAPIG